MPVWRSSKIVDFSVVLALLIACPPAVPESQIAASQPETLPAVQHDFSTLGLDSAHRNDLTQAMTRHDYPRAEAILVEESNRDLSSVRRARLLETVGGIFFLDGKYLNSAIAFKKAEAIAPLNERNSFTLAMAYIKLERSDWARQQIERLAAAYPTNSLYIYWLARLDYDAQDYGAAMAHLNKVLTADPKMTRAYDLLGLCYDYIGRTDEAIANFARAIELNRLEAKPSPWPNLDLGLALITANRLSEAEESLREALRYDERLARIHYELGRVLEMEGKYEDSARSFEAASVLDPTYAEPHYLLGRIYQRLGKAELARAEIHRFQELDAKRKSPMTKSSSPPH